MHVCNKLKIFIIFHALNAWNIICQCIEQLHASVPHISSKLDVSGKVVGPILACSFSFIYLIAYKYKLCKKR